MPMNINVLAESLIAIGLLATQVCGYAQTSGFEKPASVIYQDCKQSADTLSLEWQSIQIHENTESHKFNVRQLILPGVLIAVGTFGVYNGSFRKLDNEIKTGMDNLRGNRYIHADDYIQYIPALTYLTFGLFGVKSKHGFKERLLVESTAYLTMAALTNIGKYSFKEKRPDSNAKNSFPSGHTATVFTGAELMREEYGLGMGIGAYTIALGVSFLRIYNGRHWLNDVFAGAGLGVLSARIGYWMLPLYKRWFKWNNPSSKIILVSPSYNIENKAFSINLAFTL